MLTRYLGVRGLRLMGLWVVLALTVGACGGDDDSDGSSATEEQAEVAEEPPEEAAAEVEEPTVEPTAVPEAVPLANAVRIEDSVDARVGAEAEFASVTELVPVAVGDNVRTDSSGFAEVAYFDGSVTRLDINTDFEVVELVDDPGNSLIRTEMGVGRTWHRVAALSGNDTFEVETSVATAVVRGTAFYISCLDETTCTFAVVEGTIEVVLSDGTVIVLEAPQELTVTVDGAGEPVPLPFDSSFGDDWLFDNGLRDVEIGFAGPGEIYEAHGPQYASLNGTFDGVGETTEFRCDGPDCAYAAGEQPVGGMKQMAPQFESNCVAAESCGGRVRVQIEDNGEDVWLDATYTSRDGVLEWGTDYTGTQCYSPEGDGVGEVSVQTLWQLTPTAAEVQNDRYVVTEAAAEETFTVTWLDPVVPGCAEFQADWSSDLAWSFTLQVPADGSDEASTGPQYEGVAIGRQEDVNRLCGWADQVLQTSNGEALEGYPEVVVLSAIAGELGPALEAPAAELSAAAAAAREGNVHVLTDEVRFASEFMVASCDGIGWQAS